MGNLRTRLHLASAIVLVVGFTGAVTIYFTAGNASDGVMYYEDSKIFMHYLELYGGKANVLVHEFNRWFVGLWHGKPLAFTIACISILVSLSLFSVARHLPHNSKSDAPGED